jgi:hypothetical protein
MGTGSDVIVIREVMDMAAVFLLLVVLALIAGAIDLVRSNGRSLTSWGVVLLAVVLLLERLGP